MHFVELGIRSVSGGTPVAEITALLSFTCTEAWAVTVRVTAWWDVYVLNKHLDFKILNKGFNVKKCICGKCICEYV